jgi:hypothetical protein
VRRDAGEALALETTNPAYDGAVSGERPITPLSRVDAVLGTRKGPPGCARGERQGYCPRGHSGLTSLAKEVGL